MPLLAIKSFAKKIGKPESTVEKYWEEAKTESGKEYNKETESRKFYGTAMKILKNKLKKHEGLTESRFFNFITKDDGIHEDKFNGYVDLDHKDMELIKLFSGDKKINDHKDFHKLAEDLGLKEAAELEERAYAMLQSFWSQGRAMKKGMDFEVDEKEVKMGMEVEKEHTDNPVIAYRIAMDHLAEMPDYYTKLAKMESEGGVNESDEIWHCDECGWEGPKSKLKQPGDKCPKCGANPPVVHKK